MKEKTELVCPDCGLHMTIYKPYWCTYYKEKHNYISGCGYRANYNPHWKYCPFCGRRIHNLGDISKEND